MAKTALVLGATGGIGGEIARQLVAAGWRVRGLRRKAGGPDQSGIEWMTGDAMQRADVLRAAEGAEVIVHAVNPPGYQRWSELVLPMLDNTLAAAAVNQARVVLPGTVYNFGPDQWAHILEGAPQNPQTRKGKIRAEMERRLRQAASAGTPVLIVRFGDFFGPQVGNSWFAQGLVKPGKAVTSIANPARPGAGHQWAYVPDAARTVLRLLAQDNLPPFANYHFGGHWDADGTQMATAIQRVVQQQTGQAPAIKRFPWWLVTLASPVVTVFRELREMRYLWQQSVHMDNRQLLAQLGSEPHTPLDEAVRATLKGLKCL
ncbi:NAD-dependent epimerase/dehydratase family protein [Amantichitinum ursilacus]|uniref:NAD dependent epimerase/dehydratase family protein n=1 Tax=Amantichitinum ursilacus TaxID=857265 RepID=A0A0N0XM25_9NEIS|nr:NAD-dependent epimerase/dehydratase family protein [Amantichitinum ursilacus]KPC54664.1 NAD dependent epimerase/dehydratase family protein [Amantichitinum ursilacus]